MADLIFDKINKIITVKKPDKEITIQELYNTIRDYEDETYNMETDKICDCSGKEELGGGTYVGLTLKLIDWKLKFEDRSGPDYVTCNVRGGNLVAYDTTLGDYVNPIEPAAYVTVTLTSSSSATLQELQLTDLKYRLESLRDTHPAFGCTIYWDPINGDDDNSGDTIDSAVKTFSKALELVNDSHNDLIVGYGKEEVTITEAINITKNAVHIKSSGSGYWKWNTPGQTAITISGNQCSIEGFAVENADKGIVITGDNPDIQDFSIQNTTNEGIVYDGINNGTLRAGIVRNCGSDGVVFKNSSTGVRIFRVASVTNSGDGFKIKSGCGGIIFMTDTNAIGNSGYGINIQSGAFSNTIFGTVLVDENTKGDINDNGTETVIQSFATEGSGTSAEQVWSELTKKYRTKTGTMGHRLGHISGASTTKIIQKGIWTEKEKEKMLKIVEELNKRNKTTEKKISNIKYISKENVDILKNIILNYNKLLDELEKRKTKKKTKHTEDKIKEDLKQEIGTLSKALVKLLPDDELEELVMNVK